MRRKGVWRVMLALVLALLPAQPTYADTITVDTTGDVLDAAGSCSAVTLASLPGPDGVTSLREGLCAANGNPGPDTIAFAIPGPGGHTIQPLVALPIMSDDETTIDGYSQPGTAEATSTAPATLLIEISGVSIANNNGLNIISAGNVVRGLAINRFPWNGIAIGGAGATGNVIAGNHIGTSLAGTLDRGNGLSGVFIGLGAQGNTVGGTTAADRNVISGNGWEGVAIHGSETAGNVVSGNYIGTQARGDLALGNTLFGVRIYGGAHDNTIGGSVDGAGNLISGNLGDGVRIAGAGTAGNVVVGNYIGRASGGDASLSNRGSGVTITSGAQDNAVGGDTAGERNVLSGNFGNGVYITGTNTMSNTVSGNVIGLAADGTTDLGNGQDGVRIISGAQNNTIGGDTVGERNVISGNDEAGVWIYDSGTVSNTVSGNYIGTDANGTAALSNAGDGVAIGGGAQNNTVGGDAVGERNVISGNGGNGVGISGSNTLSNTVSGNYIGTDASGATDLGNGQDGVLIFSGAQNNTIGGDTAGERNVISGNDWGGVEIYDSDTVGNTVSGNYIGTDASGTSDLGNAWSGVSIRGGAQNNTVGGDTVGERNVISGNAEAGVGISESDTLSNTVSGNIIGLAADGTTDLGNGQDGVRIFSGAQNNTIGGDTAGERNVISGNDWSGVGIYDSDTVGNTVSGNYIGTDASGTAGLGNSGSGVSIHGGTQNNTVGGDTAGERNVISGNGGGGVEIYDSDTVGNTVSGNYIGTDANGTAVLSNIRDGVAIGGAQNNTVGGNAAGERNVISGNGGNGVGISGALSNTVSGNIIGLAADGTTDLGNGQNGVLIIAGAQNNTIGGDTAGERNVISGNDWNGVQIRSSDTAGNTVSGNYIGTDASGTLDRGNDRSGVAMGYGPRCNVVGGDTAGERNVISGNGGNGVGISDSGTVSNTVSGNYIGTDASGTAALSNTVYGVAIGGGAQNNTVGPDNVIAYNGEDGVEVYESSTTGNTITRNSIFSNTMGINLVNDANGRIAAPAILTTTLGSVRVVGTACPGCTVEVFENSDTDGEGETYVGSSTATGSGAFTVTASHLSKPYLTATATDAISGTSEFSAVFTATVMGGAPIYLPIVVRNS